MSVYMTEEEQLESIKKWWKRYGNMVTLALSIVLFVIAGYRYYGWYQEKKSQEASAAYEHMMISFSNKDIKSVKSYANELIKNYKHTVYADAAHLALAKVYVNKDKLQQARAELQEVKKQTKLSVFKDIASLRVARIYAAEKAYQEALTELSTITDATYKPVVNELKGDIYKAMGKYEEASSSYKQAIEEVKNNGMGNLFLEMKSNELAQQTSTKSSHTIQVQTG
ncbi:MAG: hypothetical protein BGO90_04550 [Legionella sp. 40-6]|nr:MAG: hypothetical protein BGO90_04550 [Legionella sp. 40-6]